MAASLKFGYWFWWSTSVRSKKASLVMEEQAQAWKPSCKKDDNLWQAIRCNAEPPWNIFWRDLLLNSFMTVCCSILQQKTNVEVELNLYRPYTSGIYIYDYWFACHFSVCSTACFTVQFTITIATPTWFQPMPRYNQYQASFSPFRFLREISRRGTKLSTFANRSLIRVLLLQNKYGKHWG